MQYDRRTFIQTSGGVGLASVVGVAGIGSAQAGDGGAASHATDDGGDGYHTTRDIEPGEVVSIVPGELLFDAPHEELRADVLESGELSIPGGTWVEDEHVTDIGENQLADATVYFPGSTWDDEAFPHLEEVVSEEDLFPGDSFHLGGELVTEDVVAVPGEILTRAIEGGVPEAEVGRLLEHSGTLFPGGMWSLESADSTAVLQSAGVRFPGDAFIPGDTFYPGDTWFPSDAVIPGDTWSPGETFYPGDTWFPGDAFYTGRMAFVTGRAGTDELHQDVDDGWLALLSEGDILLPADSWEAAAEPEASDVATSFELVRDIEPGEVVSIVPGELLFDAPHEELRADVLESGELSIPGGMWVEDGHVTDIGENQLADATVFFPGSTWAEGDFSNLETALSEEDLFPGDMFFPGERMVNHEVVAVEGATLMRTLEEDVPEAAVGRLLERSGTLYPGGMWSLESAEATATLEESSVRFSGDTLFPGDMFFPGDTLFPGDMFFPGDTFVPDETLYPGSTWFPGDSFYTGRMALVAGDAAVDELHQDLDEEWLALFAEGVFLLPADSWEAVDAADDAGEAGDADADDADDADADDAETDDDDVPGFGVTGALASLGGIGYLLKRRLAGADD